MIDRNAAKQPACCVTDPVKALLQRVRTVKGTIQFINAMNFRNVSKGITGQRNQIDLFCGHVDGDDHNGICVAVFQSFLEFTATSAIIPKTEVDTKEQNIRIALLCLGFLKLLGSNQRIMRFVVFSYADGLNK